MLTADDIRAKRRLTGLSRERMSKRLGYSPESLHDWERRDKKRRPMPPSVEVRFLAIVDAAVSDLRNAA